VTVCPSASAGVMQSVMARVTVWPSASAGVLESVMA